MQREGERLIFRLVKRFRNILTLVLVSSVTPLLLGGCASSNSGAESVMPAAAPVAGGASNGATSGIAPGEELEVYVVEDETFSGRYLVRPSGHIIFPKIGRVKLAGASASEAEAVIKRALEGSQLTSATVMVERPASQAAVSVQSVTVYLSGSIQSPGRRAVPYVAGRRPTVYQAILEAGGLARFADERRVRLTRQNASGGPVSSQIDVAQIKRGGTGDVPLQDGDIVFVPEKAFGW